MQLPVDGDYAALRAAVEDAAADLAKITCHSPMERLPKEEQLRCSMYASLKSRCSLIRAEAGYFDPDHGDRAECDLHATLEGQRSYWIELKRAWECRGWVNKPEEQRAAWEADVQKFLRLRDGLPRIFILFGFFDHDPGLLGTPLAKAVSGFHPRNLLFTLPPRPFCWRGAFTHMAAWAWRW